jgi:hypothetical protein
MRMNNLWYRRREKIGLYTMPPDDLVRKCLRLASTCNFDWSKLLSSRDISDNFDIKFAKSTNKLSEKAVSKDAINLSWCEAISIGLVAELIKISESTKHKYRIGVQIADSHKNEREMLFSDGLIERIGEGIITFQQVLAQNILGKNKDEKIEIIAVDNVSNKLKKRLSYGVLEHTGLILSVFTDDFVDINLIFSKWDAKIYAYNFLVRFRNNLKFADVYSYIGDGQSSTKTFALIKA